MSKRPFLVHIKLFATCMNGVFVLWAGMMCVLKSIWTSMIFLKQKVPTVASRKLTMRMCSIAQQSEEP